jgi:hypothetical protein
MNLYALALIIIIFAMMTLLGHYLFRKYLGYTCDVPSNMATSNSD